MKGEVTVKASKTPGRRHRRSRFVINPAFQWRYAFSIGVVIFFFSTVMSIMLFGAMHNQAQNSVFRPGSTIAETLPVALAYSVGLAAMTAGAVGIWCLVSSHRVCGPLHVLEHYFKDLTVGRIPMPRALRKRDEFKDFYAKFSQAMEALRDEREWELDQLTAALSSVHRAGCCDETGRRREMGSAAHTIEKLRTAVAASLGCDVPPLPHLRPAAPNQPEVPQPAGAT